jgi:hypothetical protein
MVIEPAVLSSATFGFNCAMRLGCANEVGLDVSSTAHLRCPLALRGGLEFVLVFRRILIALSHQVYGHFQVTKVSLKRKLTRGTGSSCTTTNPVVCCTLL